MKRFLFEEHVSDEVRVDRWMVSYADFVTLMFVFFLALYTLVPKEVHDQLLGRLTAQAQESVSPGTQVIRDTDAGKVELLLKLKSALAPLLHSGEVTAVATRNGVRLEILDSALFDSGTAELKGDAVRLMQQVGRILAAQENSIQVEGHTDPNPIQNGLYPSNWELSAARASRVVRVLQESGVEPSKLSATGYAATKPLVPSSTSEGRARNRRVTLLIRLDE